MRDVGSGITQGDQFLRPSGSGIGSSKVRCQSLMTPTLFIEIDPETLRQSRLLSPSSVTLQRGQGSPAVAERGLAGPRSVDQLFRNVFAGFVIAAVS